MFVPMPVLVFLIFSVLLLFAVLMWVVRGYINSVIDARTVIKRAEKQRDDHYTQAVSAQWQLRNEQHEKTQLLQYNQYLQNNSIMVDPNNPLQIDAVVQKLYATYVNFGIYGHTKHVQTVLEVFYGKERNKWSKDVQLHYLSDSMAVAWYGHPFRPPSGIAYLYENYRSTQQQEYSRV